MKMEHIRNMKTVGLEPKEGVCAVSSITSRVHPGWGQSMVSPSEKGPLARSVEFV